MVGGTAMKKLSDQEPAEVFGYFEDICAIPHGSGNTRAISEYCMEFAKKRGLEAYRDGLNNVLIRKKASRGYENKPGIVIQGHLDMVCEAADGKEIDFLSEGIDARTDGEYVFAEGTTLGADDGIAAAMALALLADESISHPELEVLLTADEETGMFGAADFDMSQLRGNRLLNIDSEEEGILTAGCAGGMRVVCRIPFEKENAEGEKVRIEVCGLKGGHSGTEIDKCRGNAVKLLARALAGINFRLVSLFGGGKDNVIPSYAAAELLTEDADALEERVFNLNAALKTEYRASDADARIVFTRLGSAAQTALAEKDSRRITDFLIAAPDGVQNRSAEINGLTETSLNIGKASLTDNALEAVFLIRSSVNSRKYELFERLGALSELAGGSAERVSEYPAWEYMPDSQFMRTCMDVYRRMYGDDMRVEIIHAGLECGLFAAKRPELECVSVGPNILDVHSPKERLEIKSVKRVYEYVKAILEE